MSTIGVPPMTLCSPDIQPGGKIAFEQVYDGFDCTGCNISPALSWSFVPPGTKSFAITMFDPDAPTGSGFWHWVVYNIPKHISHISKGAGVAGGDGLPAGAMQIKNDYGVIGYGGPCPPPGPPHRYQITLFAVDIDYLSGDETTSAAMIGFQLHFHTLAKAPLNGLFGI